MTFSLEVLGANATAPSRHGAASSYLLTGDNGYVLVDAGPGSFMAYTTTHDLADLRAIVVTHLHADHSLDLMAWAYRWTFPLVRERIALFIPKGERARLEAFDKLFGIPTLSTMNNPITGNFDIHEMPMDGQFLAEIAGIKLSTFEARHAVTSTSLRFERDGRTIAFSSDTGDTQGLRDAAKNTNVFVCEATYLDPNPTAMAEHGHLTPALAGEIATDANVETLVLTHFTDPDDGPESVRRAQQTFNGSVVEAKAGLTITI